MQEKISYKKYLAFFILILIYVLFTIQYSPFLERLGSDKEVFQYIGMLIKNEKIPYTDVFDHKPPIIYLINYLGVLLTPNSTWGVFILLNTVGLFCTILIFKLASKKLKGFVLPLLVSVAYIIIINDNYVLEEGNLTRQLSSYLTTVILFIVMVNKKTAIRMFIVGFLISTIFFTQQNEILGGLVLASYYLLFKNNFQLESLKVISKHIAFFIIGLLIPFMGILLIISYWNNYNDFLNQVFFFNLSTYIDNKSFLDKMIFVIYKFAKIVFANKVLLVMLLVLLFNILAGLKNKRKWYLDSTIIILFIALFFQVVSTSISGKDYGHYFLMFIPYIIYLFVFSLRFNDFKYIKTVQILLIGVFIFNAVKLFPFEKPDKTLLETVTYRVASVKNKNGQFYSLNGRYLRVNFNLNIISPSKHVYAHFMDSESADEIINDLSENNTKYILYDKGDAHIIPQSLKSFIAVNYKEVLNCKEHILFEKIKL